MSLRNIQGSALARTHTNSAGKTPAGVTSTTSWVRNPSWLTLPSVTSSDQKLVGLFAIFPNGGNFVTVYANVNSGTYTVNWGDGSASITSATGVTQEYEYDFADADLVGTDAPVTLTVATSLISRTSHGYVDGDVINLFRVVNTTGVVSGQQYYVINATLDTFQVSESPAGSPVSFGGTDGTAALLEYRQAIITLTPTTANLTGLNLNQRHTNVSASSTSNWLDISFSVPNCSGGGLAIGGTVRHTLLQQCTIATIGGCTTTASMFNNSYSLQSVPLFNTAAVTNMTGMFGNCYALQSVPLFNTAVVTNMSNMFQNCSSLQSVPLFNTAAVSNMANIFQNCSSLRSVPLLNTAAVTSMLNMFYGCGSLQSVPLFNTAAVNNMTGMFQYCYSLQSVPLFNTASVTSMVIMFRGCASLQSVPLFNTAAVTSMSLMFANCISLQSVPLFNTAAVRDMSSMFLACAALRSVPLFNTAAVTAMNNMFQGCALPTVPLFNTAAVTSMVSMFQNSSIKSVPLFNTAAVTNMTQMFLNCTALQSIPLFNTAAVTNMSGMFNNCNSLQAIPALNVSAVTSANLANIFLNAVSISRIEASQFKFTFSIAGLELSATALNEIYTNLPTVVGQTITVTGNYGTASDDPSIATAKGWTVTG